METVSLPVFNRDTNLSANNLRRMGYIPAICYARGSDNLSIQIDYQTFRKVYDRAGKNTIIDLAVDGQKQNFKVLVHDIQYDPVYGNIDHVDFMFVRMDQEVTTNVSINFVGVSPAVKELAAVLVTHKHELEICCLPQDLIHEITVDISNLAQFHDAVHVKDIVGISSKVNVMDDPEEIVVTVVPPRTEEEEKPVAPAEGELATGAEAPQGEAVSEAQTQETAK